MVDGKIELDMETFGNNNCNNRDCSGAYGIQFNITQDIYNRILSGESLYVGFWYEWEGNDDDPFENADEVWIKARITSPSGAKHWLGTEQSSSGGDTTPEIDRRNNPDYDFFGYFYQNITQWVEGPGYYYLDLGGKLYASGSDEWGYFRFDNIQLEITNLDPINQYEHGGNTFRKEAIVWLVSAWQGSHGNQHVAGPGCETHFWVQVMCDRCIGYPGTMDEKFVLKGTALGWSDSPTIKINAGL